MLQAKRKEVVAKKLPLAPDILNLRDALRGVRHVLRRSGETLSEVPAATLPDPVAKIAGAVLRHGGELAKGADKMASGLAKRLLGGSSDSAPSMSEIIADRHAPEVFAATSYVALRAVLQQQGIEDALIVESAARAAYTQLAPDLGNAPEPILAANLTQLILDMNVVCGAGEARQLAIFAVVLWLMSDRPQSGSTAALEAAVDLASVLRQDIIAACDARDHGRLVKLYAEFINHV
jgi:hypothetical protein